MANEMVHHRLVVSHLGMRRAANHNHGNPFRISPRNGIECAQAADAISNDQCG